MNHGHHIQKPNQEQETRKPINKTGIAVTGGAFVTWWLAVSTNGVFNFFSDSPGFQLYPFCLALWAGIVFVTFQIVLRHTNLHWLFMVASVICVAVFVSTTRAVDRKNARSRPNREPHFDLVANVSEYPDSTVWLTNSAIRSTNLLPKSLDEPIFITGTDGFLFAPVLQGHAKVTIEFTLINSSHEIVDLPECKMTIGPGESSRSVTWRADPQWKNAHTRDGLIGSPEARTLWYRFPRSLLAGDGEPLPAITFEAGRVDPIRIFLHARAKDMYCVESWKFLVMFPMVSSNFPGMILPQFLLGTRTESNRVSVRFESIIKAPSKSN